MNNSLFLVTGGKGCVGKSMLSMLLIDFLTQFLKKKIFVIESDTSNPDVGKTFANNEYVEVIFLSLDNADGWIELVNHCATKNMDIVINFAARSGEAIKKFAGTLIESLEELQMALITFWLINRQRDSVELLKEYMNVVPGELHVVRNTFYGEAHKFDLFNKSNIKIEAEKRGATIDLPDLADRVADDLYSSRLSIAKAAVEMQLGSRAELKRWRSLGWQMFDALGVGKDVA